MKEYWININKPKRKRKTNLKIVNELYLQQLEKKNKNLQLIDTSIVIGIIVGVTLCIIIAIT